MRERLGHNDTLRQETKKREKRERKAVMMKMPTWALYISPLHQPAAWLLIQANLSSGNAQKEVLLGHFRKHTTSPLPSNCLNSLFLDNKLRWAGPCKRHTRSTLD